MEVRPLAKKKSFFSRYRFVYKPSPVLLKCALLTMLVVAIGALTILRVRLNQEKQYNDVLRYQAAQQAEENRALDQMIQQKDTVEGITNISESKMGMVDGDTVFYDVVTNQD